MTCTRFFQYKIKIMFTLVLFSAGVVQASVGGASYQNFMPTPAQTDYITVQSSENIRSPKWRMHLFGSLSANNFFAYEVPVVEQNKQTLSDQLFSGDFGVAYGINSQWEYGLNLPMNLNQNIKPESLSHYYHQRWVTLIHNQFKYVLQRRGEDNSEGAGMAFIASLDLPNTREDGFLGRGANPIAAIEFVYDRGNEVSSYAFNVGYRIRSPGEPYSDSPVLPLQDQLLLSAGYQSQWAKLRKLSWIAEFSGAFPLDKGLYKKATDIATAEGLLGLRGGPSKSRRWTVGAGLGLLRGSLNPDWRLFAGWSWDFTLFQNRPQEDVLLKAPKVHGLGDGIVDSLSLEESGNVVEDGDRDGVIDDDDLCPRTPLGVSVDREGCPLDRDEDSIGDFEDKCPNTPKGEVVNGQGCPVLK